MLLLCGPRLLHDRVHPPAPAWSAEAVSRA